MNNRRVVITGLGAITPLGLDLPTTWRNLLAGISGEGPITLFDPAPIPVKIAAEVKQFDPLNYMDRKQARRMDRFQQFAVAASWEALAQARLTIDDDIADQVGVVIGSGAGGIGSHFTGAKVLLERGPRRINPFTIPMVLTDMAAGQLAIILGARGPNCAVVSACASGNDAIGTAYETIRRGDAEVMLAGGAEAAITLIGVAAFDRTGALSHRNDPGHTSRPFDATRDGLVMGEGAAMLVLESLDFARKRGAEPLAEIVGYGATADAYHISAPDPEGRGAAKAMLMALRKAGLSPEEVDYINAHGTSTPLNDVTETRAIKRVFGEHAYHVPISSTKSMIGHLLGAGGAVEAAVCVMTIRENRIHPTINLQTPDPECDLDYVPQQSREAEVNVALSNSFGFGGHNACLVFRKVIGDK